jgi:hypothetical protein
MVLLLRALSGREPVGRELAVERPLDAVVHVFAA